VIKTPYVYLQIVSALLCGACTDNTREIMPQNQHTYDKAILQVNRGLFAPSATSVAITEADEIAMLHEEFMRIRTASTGKPRADWKPQGTLTFYEGEEQRWKAILGVAEWSEGGTHNIEFPLSKTLQDKLKRLAINKE
jgi:hypothetical protein